MSGLKPITVNTAPEADPHIYAEDDAAIYQSIFGSDGVMTIGQQCESQVISNNKVRVKDGVIVVGGHVARIPYGEYIDCEIANGQSGVNRNDIITAKFVTTGSGGIDTYTCEVKQGVAGSSASDPALTQNDLYAGGKIREIPLHRVKIEGLSIVAVEPLFKLVPTIPQLEEQLADLNSKISKRIAGVIQTGTNGWIYAQKIGSFIDIEVHIYGCLVGSIYNWYNIGYVDISQIGVTKTDSAWGQAYFSNQGPAYGDDGGKTTINCAAQSSGRIQLRAQSSKAFSEGRLYVATISVPISD